MNTTMDEKMSEMYYKDGAQLGSCHRPCEGSVFFWSLYQADAVSLRLPVEAERLAQFFLRLGN